PRFEIRRRDMDAGHFEVETTCSLHSIVTGRYLGQGVGLCSTMESRYRYRDAKRSCPRCGAEAIIRGREEYGGGWLCFKKQGGCGAKFDAGDPAVEKQRSGRVENPDIADTYNTVLKMSKKRALVDAVLTATAASDIFTQDLEDLGDRAAATAPTTAAPSRGEPRPFDGAVSSTASAGALKNSPASSGSAPAAGSTSGSKTNNADVNEPKGPGTDRTRSTRRETPRPEPPTPTTSAAYRRFREAATAHLDQENFAAEWPGGVQEVQLWFTHDRRSLLKGYGFGDWRAVRQCDDGAVFGRFLKALDAESRRRRTGAAAAVKAAAGRSTAAQPTPRPAGSAAVYAPGVPIVPEDSLLRNELYGADAVDPGVISGF
ncbi:MAG: hypothetical protein ACRC1K_12350, partial [Planctomycetia bacterium]